MKIFEAHTNILTAIKLLNILKQNPENTSQLQHDVNLILSKFTPEIVKDLKGKLNKKKKKRDREARLRKYRKEVFKEKERNKKIRNDEVDLLFRQHQEVQERSKVEESVRRQADVVLQTVTRRKAEARRVIALLASLVRLRAGRCQEQVARGGNVSVAVSEAFQTSITNLKSLWEKQLDEYSKEEAGLKVMLEEGSATKLGRAEREFDATLHDWRVAMFGESTHSEMSWQHMIDNRAQWDEFIAGPDTILSSGMPIGWILPQPLTNEEWKKAVVFD